MNSYSDGVFIVYDPAEGIYKLSEDDLHELLIIKDWNGIPAPTISDIAGEYKIIAIKK